MPKKTGNKPLDISDLPSMPIKMLRFPPDRPQMLPQRGSCSSVTDNRHDKPSKHRIDYLPAIRQYRVTFGSGDGLVTTCIPEGAVLNALHYSPGECKG